jgi:uncharacterized protein DUF5941
MSPFVPCRDDGPLARTLGAALGPVVQLPAIALVAAGTAALLLVLTMEAASASDALTGAALGCFVLAAGASRGRPHTDALRWAVVPLLRLGEYAALLWLGALAGGSGPAAAFALVAVLAFRHYDLFYRPRFLGTWPPQWVGDAGGGWEGRLLIAYLLLATDALPAGLFVMAAILGVLFVTESVLAWRRLEPAGDG